MRYVALPGLPVCRRRAPRRGLLFVCRRGLMFDSLPGPLFRSLARSIGLDESLSFLVQRVLPLCVSLIRVQVRGRVRNRHN